MLKVRCPQCRTALVADHVPLGARVGCRKCGHIFRLELDRSELAESGFASPATDLRTDLEAGGMAPGLAATTATMKDSLDGRFDHTQPAASGSAVASSAKAPDLTPDEVLHIGLDRELGRSASAAPDFTKRSPKGEVNDDVFYIAASEDHDRAGASPYRSGGMASHTPDQTTTCRTGRGGGCCPVVRTFALLTLLVGAFVMAKMVCRMSGGSSCQKRSGCYSASRSGCATTGCAVNGSCSSSAQLPPLDALSMVLGVHDQAHTAAVRALAISPDGQHIATAGDDQTLLVWQRATGRKLYTLTLGQGPAVEALAFTDNRHLVYARGSTLGLVQLGDKTPLRLLSSAPVSSGRVAAMALSPDAKSLAVAGSGRVIGLLPVADLLNDTTASDLPRPFATTLTGHEGSVSAVAFSPNGQTLASISEDNTLRLWAVSTGKAVGQVTLSNKPTALAFTADGQFVLLTDTAAGVSLFAMANLSDKPVRLSVAGGQPLTKVASLDGLSSETATAGQACSAAPATSFVTASQDGQIHVWRLAVNKTCCGTVSLCPDSVKAVAAQGPALTIPGAHMGSVTALAISTDGENMITTGADGTVRMWLWPAVLKCSARSAATLPMNLECPLSESVSEPQLRPTPDVDPNGR